MTSRCLGLIVACLVVIVVKGQDCAWNRASDFPLHPPIMVDLNTNKVVYAVMEAGSRMVRVAAGTPLALACPGSTVANVGVVTANATCAGGKLLLVAGTEWKMVELGCSSQAKESIQRSLGPCGDAGRGTMNSIGFEIYSTLFYDQILVCFEPVRETTIYATHVVHGASTTAKDTGGNRPSFRQSTGFYTVTPDNCYKQASQQALMITLLGDQNLASSIIDIPKNLYFSRGHIAPDADFILQEEQDATYYYINAHPQWQVCNNGNWKFLEDSTRSLADRHQTDLTIYTGATNTLMLDDINANPVAVFLGLTENQEVIPAPELLWRVIHESSTGRAVAIISVNNPHLTAPPTPVCPDICPSISWLTFQTTDLVLGFTYCCTAAQLRAAVPDAPDLGDVGLLDS